MCGEGVSTLACSVQQERCLRTPTFSTMRLCHQAATWDHSDEGQILTHVYQRILCSFILWSEDRGMSKNMCYLLMSNNMMIITNMMVIVAPLLLLTCTETNHQENACDGHTGEITWACILNKLCLRSAYKIIYV